MRHHIARHFQDKVFYGGLTYNSHPMGCAAALATIRVYEEDGLIENAKKMGAIMKELGAALQAKHPSVGDVRGMGLFFAVEIVKNRETKKLFNTNSDKVEGKPLVVDQIAAKMLAQGVSIQAWVSHFVIAPPLIVTKEELDFGIAALDEHLAIADGLVE